jgi:hypothetical protein
MTKRQRDANERAEILRQLVEQQHHIIHLNGQRITKDEMLVIGLCHPCHTGSKESVHQLGGERKFLEHTGWNLVEIAVLRRHNWELRK